GFVFGSEIKAILEFPGVSKGTDLTAISDYLSLIYVPSPKTVFKEIRKLPPAHYAVVGAGGTAVRPYWDLSFHPRHRMSEESMMEELLAILEEATRIRMISEVPLGSFLSGGVDPSAVVALMAGLSKEPIKTSSISFSVAAYNEIEYARQVAGRFHTDHHEFHVTPEAVPVIEKLAWHYDEPFADSSAVPTYYVSKTAREHVTVALSGDGGDENFAGYRRYAFDLRENAVRDLVPALFRRSFFAGLGRLYPKADYLPQLFRGKAFISNVARDPVGAYFHSVSAVDDDRKSRLLNGDALRALNGYRSSDLFRELYERAPARDHLSKIQYIDIKTYLCEDILTKVDRASMAVSLEVRCPLLDHVFMEYAARIPAGLKLNGGEGKHIFKKALQPRLPKEILYRRKRGFAVPVMEWLRGELKEYARDLVIDGPASRLYLEKSTLGTMWKEHQRGVRNWSTEIWSIMMLNLWHKRFLT
ncbi:MAG: asparagine synthase (glutamine-hydrolyzing), partial [Deltaproteobacteria bacterium]|nr:asparagine synthase (glutamine-hydrolyzing) [Deltaproteobacteria bacterium]